MKISRKHFIATAITGLFGVLVLPKPEKISEVRIFTGYPDTNGGRIYAWERFSSIDHVGYTQALLGWGYGMRDAMLAQGVYAPPGVYNDALAHFGLPIDTPYAMIPHSIKER